MNKQLMLMREILTLSCHLAIRGYYKIKTAELLNITQFMQVAFQKRTFT
ncbi:hypothetical protein SAMN05421677_10756 [Halobacillus aidingensis]|uniref:Uncharacterized protein n=1 Tax=Halobacillus aidingensis TaxID=240303 RepID=A0A1H0LLX1_HALAD|nr:hypothetical protein SAMN05421677_10756 [Halobacillus aidingensis]